MRTTSPRPTDGNAAAPVAGGTSGRSLSNDIHLLVGLLGEVIQLHDGLEAFELEEEARRLAKAFRAGRESAGEELDALVSGVSVAEAEFLIRSFTKYFQLVNLAEDNDRLRQMRDREGELYPAPRPDSLRQAIQSLADCGTSADQLRGLLERAEVRLVLTAHPTEARRRTTVEKLARIFAVIRELDERRLLPRDLELARARLAATVEELWGSDEIRAVSPTVLDEVRAGLVYFQTVLVHVIPRLYRDLEDAIAEAYPGEHVPVPPFLSFGSWIGGDRDGNPFVTPAVTEASLEIMREAAVRFLEGRVQSLAERVSLSSQVFGPAPLIEPLLTATAARFPELAATLDERNRHEPYRRALTLIRQRLTATREGAPEGYAAPEALLADLRLVERSLREQSGGFVADGDLHDVIREVEVFGFHFARLDVRDHRQRHQAALAELLSVTGVEPRYAELSESQRLELLAREIANPRPLVPADLSALSVPAREVMEGFQALHRLLTTSHRGAIRTYVISHTRGPSDVLEVLLLMKEAGLTRVGGPGAMVQIAPLFESRETLEGSAQTMARLLDEPSYRAALAAWGDAQEIMIGYSDSNKEVGYLGSGWAIYEAQRKLAALLEHRGVRFTFFHGRGGSIGRGGGASNVAILAQPPGTVEGRLKLTKQGEVVAAKFSGTEIAHRELELVASAVLLSTVRAHPQPPAQRLERFESVMKEMAERSCQAYRELVYGDPGFVAFFKAATPLEEIARLRLGSRPARRDAGDSVEGLRAIPWVFSWTQARINLPGWFGLGTALAFARERVGLEFLREMERSWPFFAALLSNSEQAMAKADLQIADRYARLVADQEVRESVWGRIRREFELTTEELLAVTGQERLLDRDPMLQRSIERRNPYLDPLSFIQVELLRRVRRDGTSPSLTRAVFLAINGIAGGLRNTG